MLGQRRRRWFDIKSALVQYQWVNELTGMWAILMETSVDIMEIRLFSRTYLTL